MNMGTDAPSLAAVQGRFQDFLLGYTRNHPQFIGNTTGAVVYAEAYLARLAEALAHDYPALRAQLGDDEFAALARRYALAHPSGHYSIRWFGRHLPAFLRATPDFAARPHVAELAQVEWLLGEAFDAADARVIGLDALSDIPADAWGALRLAFHPSLRRLDLHFDTFLSWRALTGKDQARPPVTAAPGSWAIWRRDLDVLYRELAADEAIALDALCRGEPLGEVALRLVEERRMSATDAPANLADWIRNWIGSGLVSSARTSASNREQ